MTLPDSPVETDPVSGPERSGSDRRGPQVRAALIGARKRLLPILLLPGCALLFYAETFMSMVGVWRGSNTFVHGFLILPISAFGIWRRRAVLGNSTVRPSITGFVMLALAVFVWLLSGEAYAQVGQHFALIAIIVTSIWSVLGLEAARTIRFPLLFTFFAVPSGEFLIPPLMAWTAGFTVWALNATGIPVYLEGYLFALPSGSFEVIEACSGIRYLIVTVVLAIYFAHERFRSATRRIFFVVGAAAAIIVANGIRAYLIVLIAHLSEMKFGTGQDHIYFGWFVFLLSVLLIFWVGARFSDLTPGEAVNGGSVAPHGNSGERADRGVLLSTVAAIAIIGAGSLVQQVVRSIPSDVAPVSRLPYGAGPWSGPGPIVLAYRPMFHGDFQATHGSYTSEHGTVEVHGIFFAEQSQGNELINHNSRLFDSRAWRVIERLETETVSLEGTTMKVNRVMISDGRDDILLWYWYDVGGWLTTSAVATKLYHAIQGIGGSDAGDAVIVLATPASPARDAADSARLTEFLDRHAQALSACLRSRRSASAECTEQGRPTG